MVRKFEPLRGALLDGRGKGLIGNHVGDRDRDCDDTGVVTFLQHCDSIDIPVFVHPWDMAFSPRLDRWMAQWLVGMAAETHLSILSLILGGVFDRVDPALRLCFAHVVHSPSGWGVFRWTSLFFEEAPLRLLVDTLGVGNVMVGWRLGPASSTKPIE